MKTVEILLVDDDVSLLQLLPQLIRTHMPKVKVVSEVSPQNAVRRIQVMKYDAIVSDLSMPEMNGFALLDEVKKAQPLTPFLLMTGAADESFRATAREAGVRAILQKPFHPDDFMAQVRDTLEHELLWRHLKAHEKLLAQITRHVSTFERRQLADEPTPLLFLQKTQELTRRLLESLRYSVSATQELYEGVLDLNGTGWDPGSERIRMDSLRRQALLLGMQVLSRRSSLFRLPRRGTGLLPSKNLGR